MYIVCKWDAVRQCYNYFNCYDSYSKAREARDSLQRMFGSSLDHPFEIHIDDEDED